MRDLNQKAGIYRFTGCKKLRKSKEYTVPYDPYTQYPVIRASICNGERVAGFKSREDGHFTEVTFITSDAELKAFMDAYGLEDIKTEY